MICSSARSRLASLSAALPRLGISSGRHINRRYRGKLETVLERRDEGFPVLRSYYKSSCVKHYEKGNLLLRTETCLNDTYHLNIGRKLANLPALKQHWAATTDRYLEQQAELLDSTIDTGALAKLAAPVMVGTRRVPGIKLHDDRVIRLLDCSTPAACSATGPPASCINACWRAIVSPSWTTPSLSSAIDLGKLRAHALAQRVGTSRRYRLTADGVRLGALLVKIRTRLLGRSSPHRPTPLHRAATIPARWKRHSAASITLSTISARPWVSPPPDLSTHSSFVQFSYQ